MDLIARVVARWKEASDKEADAASNRVRNVKPWLQSAARELKRAEQVLLGVKKEFETFHKSKDAVGDITDLSDHASDLRHRTEALAKDLEGFAKRNK